LPIGARGASLCRAVDDAEAPIENKSLIWINDGKEQTAKV
jgi:hypothetical protein